MFTKAERLISLRNLRPKKKEGFLKVISIFSFLGIMLGVAILIIVMSVMNGFKNDLTKKILGLNPHVIIESNSFKIENEFIEKLKKKFQNINISKTYSGEGIVVNNGNAKGIIIKGIDSNNKEHSGGTAVNVGNPHIVFFVNEIENFNIEKIGPKIENHKIFPEKCNVTIATIINKNLIRVKVWERGAGLTKACGTAACATAFAGKLNDLTENKTDIEFQTGKLSILIDDKNSIHMKGPVSEIKEIEFKL